MLLIHQFCIIFIFLGCSCQTMAQTYTDADNLMTAMLTGYNRKLRPVIDVTKALPVQVRFSPSAIIEFDFVKEVMHLAVVLTTAWVDEKITWTPASYNNLEELSLPQEDVWVPPIVLVNPADKVALFSQDWMAVRYNSSGFATYDAGQVLKATCPLDVTFWPFDEQTCTFSFAALGYMDTEVLLMSSDVSLDFYDANGEWELIETSGINSNLLSTSTAVYTLRLKRRPTFLLVNLLLPVIFLMGLSVCVFFLPAESGERVGYAITVLLSISVFFTVLSDFLPSTSQPLAAVTYFVMINFILSILICFGTMVSLRLHLTPESVPAPSWCKPMVRIILCKWKKNVVGTADTDVNQTEYQTKPSSQQVKLSEQDSESENPAQQCPGQEPLTWKMLGNAVDMIQFCFFSVLITVLSLWFLIAMSIGH